MADNLLTDEDVFGSDEELLSDEDVFGSSVVMPRSKGLQGLPKQAAPAAPQPQRPLPDGVTPSNAGAGRGSVNPLPAAVRQNTMPYADKAEALDDAVNLLEEGANPQEVFAAYAKGGIGQDEIASHGAKRGSAFFAPQTTRPVQGERFSRETGDQSVNPMDIGIGEDVLNTARRGTEQFKQSVAAGMLQAGALSPADTAEQMRVRRRMTERAAPAEATAQGLDRLQKANETGEWGPVLEAVADPQNWRALASLVGESAVATGPVMIASALATAIGGAAGGMPVATAASFAQEYTAALADELEKRGIDSSDPVKVAAALADADIREAIDQRGRIRGAAVGAFDGLTMGVAASIGRTLRRVEQAGRMTRGKAAAGAGLGAAVETGGGMAGEALGQAGVGESKKLDVLVEGLAEAPSGAIDVVAGFLQPRQKPNAPVLPPTQARAASIDRFGELAAGFGLPEKALAKAREAAANMPAGDVPGFLGKLADAYNKRGMFAKPLDPAAVEELQAAIDGPTEPAAKPKATVPDQALNVTGLADEETQAEPAQVESDSSPTVESDSTAPVEGEKINRNWSAFAPETGTLNVPRSQMPQIAAEHRGALVNFLNARGVAHEMATVDPAELKPTQAEFEPKKVAGMAQSPSGRSLLVSADGHILDGHHQWLAARERGEPVRVVRLDADIQDLLRLAHQFPSSTVAKGPTRKAANDQPVVPDPAVGVPGAGAAGADPAGAGAGTVRPVAADADGGATVDPAAPAAGGGSGVPAGRDGAPDAALSREPSKIRRGQIGDKMTPGEVVLTAGGRQTTPFPRFSLNSNRGVQAGVRAVDRWLLENAAAEARARGDEFNAKPFEADAELKSIPQASKDAAEEYLFGEQPQIAPSILKPLVPQNASARVIGSYGKTPNAATEVELRPNADGTLTPHADGYAMVDFETGDPIKLPADVTDSGAAKAIRESGAVSSKTKFFNVKPDADEAQAQAEQEKRLTARERIDGLKKLLACLQS